MVDRDGGWWRPRAAARALVTVVLPIGLVGALAVALLPPDGVMAVGLVALCAAVAVALRTPRDPATRGRSARGAREGVDPLTGLLDRVAFERTVGPRCEPTHATGALLSLDLDRFTHINELHGRNVGDALLREVAARTCAVLGPSCTVARLGGDEFMAWAPSVATAEQARATALRVLSAVGTRMRTGGLLLDPDPVVGAALVAGSERSVAHLSLCAETARKHAKSRGSGVAVYDPRMPGPRTVAVSRGELQRSIDEGRFMVHYQPQVAFRTGAVESVEALVRWDHPDRGAVMPDVFIPLAEQTGLSSALTRVVLRRSLQDVREMRRTRENLRVAVNLSARDLLDASLPADVASLLLQYDLPGDALELEVTETSAILDLERSLAVLHRLRDLGIHLAIDDFGTGHASLSQLAALPVGALKIDKSFVLNMGAPSNEAIVRSTVELGRTLGMRIVAEGIEDEGSWRFLAELGCDLAQGYLLSRAVQVEHVASVVLDVENRLASLVRLAPVTALPVAPVHEPVDDSVWIATGR